jgi:hypothetical protein
MTLSSLSSSLSSSTRSSEAMSIVNWTKRHELLVWVIHKARFLASLCRSGIDWVAMSNVAQTGAREGTYIVRSSPMRIQRRFRSDTAAREVDEELLISLSLPVPSHSSVRRGSPGSRSERINPSRYLRMNGDPIT